MAFSLSMKLPPPSKPKEVDHPSRYNNTHNNNNNGSSKDGILLWC